MDAPSKTVQELLIEGQQVPEAYIQRGGGDGAPAPFLEIPTIDLCLLDSNSGNADELRKFKSALSTPGCFQAINHGMTPDFLDQVREITKQFFQLPMEEKQKYCKQVGDDQGYGSDAVLSDQQKLDWTDRLSLILYPEHQRKLKFWPENHQTFRRILNDYTIKVQRINEVIFKAMARSLNLEDNCFLDQYGEEAELNARFNFYPQCPRPELVLGLKPHADGSAITFVLQDKYVEGLQYLKDNQWFTAPINPVAILVNIGDQVEISSNGMFKSPIHRVVTNSERERISLAVFYFPESDREIEPFEKLIDNSRPRLYRKVQNYLDVYRQCFLQGKRAIDAVKLQI